jgi:hypothetical protein
MQIAKAIQEEYTFEGNEVAKIGDLKITMEEFMLYSVDTVNSYESTYGEDIWSETTLDDNGETDTYENIVKQEIFEEIRMVKAFIREAEQLGITSSDDEKEVIEENADAYYEDLAKAGVTENEEMTRELVRQFYQENYLAQKVYTYYQEQYPVDEDDTDSTYSDEFVDKCSEIIQEYYPDFNYEYNINWELLNELNFSGNETDSSASDDGDMEGYDYTLHTFSSDSDEEDEDAGADSEE